MNEQTAITVPSEHGPKAGKRFVVDDQWRAYRHLICRSEVDWITGCWNWSLGLASHGYPYTRWNHKKVRANRLAYAAMRQETPGGLLVCHSCDNPTCVNPAHLFIGTSQDNTMDAVRKNRQRFPDMRGERSPHSRLKASQVIEIRRLCAIGVPQKTIAARFGIGQQSVSRIKNKLEWRHL